MANIESVSTEIEEIWKSKNAAKKNIFKESKYHSLF